MTPSRIKPLSDQFDITNNVQIIHDELLRTEKMFATPKKRYVLRGWVKRSLYLAVQCMAILVVIAALVVVLGGGA